MTPYKTIFKPILDRIAASIFLVLFSPILVIVIGLLFFANNGAIFYTQRRPGYKGKPFRIIKFKTMRDTKDKHGNLLPDKDRITKIGKLIRNWSIDELMQLVNVLRGEMSIIGPRPLLMEYMEKYNPDQKRRHDVLPGITGWAQVNGRNAISWESKFEYDVEYVDRISLQMDLRILYWTVVYVLKRKDVNKEGHATTTKFEGTVRIISYNSIAENESHAIF